MRSATLFLRICALTALVGATPKVARGQAPGASGASAESVCLGFAFGGFTPKLDWAKAGHAPIRNGAAAERTADGRDWASDIATPNDSTLYLFPSWWPVGVLVELPGRRPAPGDTLLGRATALVARGNVTPPVAAVKAWRVPCGRPAPPPPTLAPPTSDTLHRARPER
jgi:hypothetical protein